MATINVSSNINLDDVSYATNDIINVITANTLTVNSDISYNRGSPVQVNANVPDGGGAVLFDGRDVQEIDFTSPSGSLAYGDIVTGGTSGATGEFIRQISSTRIKFRSVTGAFTSGESLTAASWSATANGTNRTSWLEMGFIEGGLIGGLANNSVKFLGAWYDLATTAGTASEVITLTGIFTTRRIPCLWIETSAGSGVYKKWVNINDNTNIPIAAQRSDSRIFTHVNNSASVTFGDGVNGAIPPAGAKVRIPNLVIYTTSVALSPVATLPALATMIETSTTGSVELELNKVTASGFYLNTSAVANLKIEDCGLIYGFLQVNSIFDGPVNFKNIGISPYLNLGIITASNIVADITFEDIYIIGSTNSFSLLYLKGSTVIKDCEYYVDASTSVNSSAINFSTNITLENCLSSDYIAFTGSSNITVINHTYQRKFGLATITYGCYFSDCSDVTIEGFEINDTAFTNTSSGSLIYNIGCRKITIKNIGTRLAPLNMRLSRFVITSTNMSQDIVIARCFFANGTVGQKANNTNLSYGIIWQNCGMDVNYEPPTDSNESYIKGYQGFDQGIGGTTSLDGDFVATTDTNFVDGFHINGVDGLVALQMCKNISKNFYQVTAGTPIFNLSGDLYMKNVGDQVVFTNDYFILGHEAFANDVPIWRTSGVSAGSLATNMTAEYQLDTGSGFSGTWKLCTGANLSAETISPITGFRIKIRLTTVVAATNIINGFGLKTTTTQASIDDNLYPIRPTTYTLTLNNLQPNSEIRIYAAGTTTEITGVENSGTSFSYVYDPTALIDTDVDIVIHSLGYLYEKITGVDLGSGNVTLPIQQRIDRQYQNI